MSNTIKKSEIIKENILESMERVGVILDNVTESMKKEKIEREKITKEMITNMLKEKGVNQGAINLFLKEYQCDNTLYNKEQSIGNNVKRIKELKKIPFLDKIEKVLNDNMSLMKEQNPEVFRFIDVKANKEKRMAREIKTDSSKQLKNDLLLGF